MKTLRILAGGAAQSLVEKARPGFEAAGGCIIDGTFSAVGAMRDRLLAGEPADPPPAQTAHNKSQGKKRRGSGR